MKIPYDISEKAFLKVWEEYNCPKIITDTSTIEKFLNSLVNETNGQFIQDHINNGSFDKITAIKYDGTYFKIIWRDFDKMRRKKLENTLSPDSESIWATFGYATYSYIITKIQSIRFINYNGHLFVAILSELNNQKDYEKWIKKNNYELINSDTSDDFEIDYYFWEGDKKDFKKHICHAHCLPYYANLLQPKENCTSNYIAQKILIFLTYEDVRARLRKAIKLLETIDENDYDSLSDIGNRIRRITEKYLKYFCARNKIKIDITTKYKHISLGDLKKKINNEFPDLIEQRLINLMNDYSHDSGVQPQKNEIILFANDAEQLVINASRHL